MQKQVRDLVYWTFLEKEIFERYSTTWIGASPGRLVLVYE